MNLIKIVTEIKMVIVALALCLFLALICVPAFAQTTDVGSPAPAGSTADTAPADAGAAELPRQFRQIELGMNLAALKESLQNDSLFSFRGDRDVSFLPVQQQNLVETTGPTFVRRAFFQLHEDGLFIMAFALNTTLVDHYSIFTGFVKKYGEPTSLSPKEAIWETDTTRVALERPLTVKYIDKVVFDELINNSKVLESGQVQLRQDFLDEF